jgi:redox-sensitive bicupin YhaK (pirin superfamily)
VLDLTQSILSLVHNVKSPIDRASPFIVLEQIGPMLIEPGIEDKILPRPRRGYEAVTLLFSGALQHSDSLGNNNLLLAGDVLWLTAGKGIIHSEYRPEEFSKIGGLYHALHFWVNYRVVITDKGVALNFNKRIRLPERRRRRRSG